MLSNPLFVKEGILAKVILAKVIAVHQDKELLLNMFGQQYKTEEPPQKKTVVSYATTMLKVPTIDATKKTILPFPTITTRTSEEAVLNLPNTTSSKAGVLNVPTMTTIISEKAVLNFSTSSTRRSEAGLLTVPPRTSETLPMPTLAAQNTAVVGPMEPAKRIGRPKRGK